MKPLKPPEVKFWNQYLVSLPSEERAGPFFVEANFAGNRELADQLLALYLAGKKTAGSGLLKDYQTVGDPLPKIGNHWIILDSQEQPRCIVRTERVEFHKFKNMPEAVAKAEGEGDGSLAYWRQAHTEFFQPFLGQWGIDNLEEAEVVVEFFKVVFSPA